MATSYADAKGEVCSRLAVAVQAMHDAEAAEPDPVIRMALAMIRRHVEEQASHAGDAYLAATRSES
jgi:hypothetical protein